MRAALPLVLAWLLASCATGGHAMPATPDANDANAADTGRLAAAFARRAVDLI